MNKSELGTSMFKKAVSSEAIAKFSKEHSKSCWIKGRKMKHYYAIFKKTKEAIEVSFSDLQGCVTFGKDLEEALDNAEDTLAAWLAH
jgi:hypothetical protein